MNISIYSREAAEQMIDAVPLVITNIQGNTAQSWWCRMLTVKQV